MEGDNSIMKNDPVYTTSNSHLTWAKDRTEITVLVINIFTIGEKGGITHSLKFYEDKSAEMIICYAINGVMHRFLDPDFKNKVQCLDYLNEVRESFTLTRFQLSATMSPMQKSLKEKLSQSFYDFNDPFNYYLVLGGIAKNPRTRL